MLVSGSGAAAQGPGTQGAGQTPEQIAAAIAAAAAAGVVGATRTGNRAPGKEPTASFSDADDLQLFVTCCGHQADVS